MSDAPSNLPFDPLDEVPPAPPLRPSTPPVPPIPMAEPIVPPSRPVSPPAPPSAPAPAPVVRPVAPSVPAAEIEASGGSAAKSSIPEDVFAGIETAPVAPAVSRQQAPLPPPVVAEGHRSGIILAIVGLFLLVGAGGATWWYFFRPAPVTPAVQTVTNSQDRPIVPPPAQEPTNFDSSDGFVTPVQIVPLPEPVTTPPSGTSIPFPGAMSGDAPVMPTAPQPNVGADTVTSSASQPAVQFDTDGDGLTDVREQELGTNAARFDTDGDTLGDGQEVLTYGTNPLNTDTDGDGFPDGVEIQNGFNPRGTGQCSQPDCRL